MWEDLPPAEPRHSAGNYTTVGTNQPGPVTLAGLQCQTGLWFLLLYLTMPRCCNRAFMPLQLYAHADIRRTILAQTVMSSG